MSTLPRDKTVALPVGITILDNQLNPIGTITSWEPGQRPNTAPFKELGEFKSLSFAEKTTHTVSIKRAIVSVSLLFDHYILHDPRRLALSWAAFGLSGQLGPWYASGQEAIAALPLYNPLPDTEDVLIQDGVQFWGYTEGLTSQHLEMIGALQDAHPKPLQATSLLLPTLQELQRMGLAELLPYNTHNIAVYRCTEETHQIILPGVGVCITEHVGHGTNY